MIKLFTKKRKGFTLIELIVVIAILGILAAIAVPRLSNLRHEATVKAEGATAVSMANAARIQETATGEITTEIDASYMVVPETPSYTLGGGGAEPYTVTWETEAGGTYDGVTFVYTEGTEFNPTTSASTP